MTARAGSSSTQTQLGITTERDGGQRQTEDPVIATKKPDKRPCRFANSFRESGRKFPVSLSLSLSLSLSPLSLLCLKEEGRDDDGQAKIIFPWTCGELEKKGGPICLDRQRRNSRNGKSVERERERERERGEGIPKTFARRSKRDGARSHTRTYVLSLKARYQIIKC